jgi:hypothetical protein
MSYIEIMGKCEEADEPSYTNKSTGEVVTKIQLSLVLPAMRDRLQFELPLDRAPSPTSSNAGNWKNRGWSSPVRACAR